MNDPTPGLELHLKVRSAFVGQGTSLGAWCLQNDLKRQAVRDVLIGRWNGPKGKALRRKVLKAAGLSASA